MPGLVDTHVHINEPGRTEWEGFETATRAAAAGGVTTLVDMPLNSIPATTTVEAFAAKRRAAEGRCHVDVGFWGGVIPGNARRSRTARARGVRGFKCFLSPSGVDDSRRPRIRSSSAMPIVAPTGCRCWRTRNGPRYSSSRRARIRGDIRHGCGPAACGRAGGHRSDAGICRRALARACISSTWHRPTRCRPSPRRGRGVQSPWRPVRTTSRSAPKRSPTGATARKCAPPIRERDHRERLWQALRDGEIDLVATDHSPAPPALKHLDDGDFIAAWGGIASLQLALPVMWTGARQRGIPFERLAQWMCAAPAKLAGFERRKGAIAMGHDADRDRRSRSRVHRRRISPVSSPCHHAI